MDDARSQKSHKSHVSIEFSDEAEILRAASGGEEDDDEIVQMPDASSALANKTKSSASASFHIPRPKREVMSVGINKRLSASFYGKSPGLGVSFQS